MEPDIVVDYDAHLKSGRVWRVDVEVPTFNDPDDLPDDVPSSIVIGTDVVAHNQSLARYIAECLYPDFLSICVPDEPQRVSA